MYDSWYDPHDYNSDDSEMTVNYGDNFPGENIYAWSPNKSPTIHFLSNVVKNLVTPK